MFKPRRIAPQAGQESVWDYPRPPRLEKVAQILRVEFNGEVVAETSRGFRVLETSHPPVYYFNPADIAMDRLHRAEGASWCEFKGQAVYWSLVIDGKQSDHAAWSYPAPVPAFANIAGHLAFYASRVDACWVGNERVQAQAGDFYGGWITSQVVGPFKGTAETRGW